MWMADHTTYLNYTVTRAGLVESVTVRQTAQTDKYPSGWDYSFHLGTLGGVDLLRYDNAHERTKSHELHVAGGDHHVSFPGMWNLLVRFYTEVDVFWQAVGVDPAPFRPY